MKDLYTKRLCKVFALIVLTCLSEFAFAQIPISGRVTGETGDGLPGVNVIVKGSSQGTITNVEGKYTIDVPSRSVTLVFSYVGYVTEEVAVGDRSTLGMLMTPDVTALSEIIVVGYGTSKKKDITGAISTISSEDFARVPVINPLDALAGRAPGLSITSTSGMPGSSPNVVIRGVTSFGGNENTNGASSLFPINSKARCQHRRRRTPSLVAGNARVPKTALHFCP
jgi:hypothetical protein